MRSVSLAAGALAVLPQAMAGFNADSASNVAVYWGQNSYNQGSGPLAQQRLSYYCANSEVEIIPIAFMNGISPPITNFANAGNNCTAFSDNANVLNCPQLAQDIVTCQQQYGKTILLSLGGAGYTQGGFQSASDAQSAAQQVWNMFGTNTNSGADRPFGSAVVDGFDFDFESGMSNLEPFAAELRGLMDASGKKMYLTAAPQCPYPDYSDNSALSSSVKFDFVMVQYYNNGCGASSYRPGYPQSQQYNFNFNVWDDWAHNVSANPNVKVLMGIPANTGAGSGYVSGTQLSDVITFVKQYSSFGGIMMWDMSQLYANSGFLQEVVSDLGGSGGGNTGGSGPTTTPTGPTQTTTASGFTTKTTKTTASPTTTAVAGQYDQCGGAGYTGPTACQSGWVCTEISSQYSQCDPVGSGN